MRYRGYYYDQETGLYYVGSRYYDPEVGRFISCDNINFVGDNGDLSSFNLYVYCGNNPIIRIDIGGHAWETIFDVLSLGASILEAAFNPADPFAWMGLAGDTVDLIPFVTGVGETIRALKTTKYVAEEGMEGAIDTYHHLKRINEGTNMEVHHIVEKRFSPQLNYGKTGSSMPSIALEKDVHRGYTNDWRKVLPYGKTRKSREILQAAIKVYGNNPRMLGAAIFTITRG